MIILQQKFIIILVPDPFTQVISQSERSGTGSSTLDKIQGFILGVPGSNLLGENIGQNFFLGGGGWSYVQVGKWGAWTSGELFIDKLSEVPHVENMPG